MVVLMCWEGHKTVRHAQTWLLPAALVAPRVIESQDTRLHSRPRGRSNGTYTSLYKSDGFPIEQKRYPEVDFSQTDSFLDGISLM